MTNISMMIEEAKICQENIDAEIRHQSQFVLKNLLPYVNKMVAIKTGDKTLIKGVIPAGEPLSVFNSTIRLVVHLYRPGENKPMTKRRRVIPFNEIEDIQIFGEYKPEAGRS